MADAPLFYQNIVPLDRERHRKLRLVQNQRPFAFAAKSHMIPAVVDEFVMASRFLPIVFLPSSPHPSPVFLVGARTGQNLYVDKDGKWAEGYVPAFVRRYPFMLGTPENGAPIICVDEKHEGLRQNGAGDRLFSEDGAETPVLQEFAKLTESYFAAAKRTETFLETISALQLLRGVTIEMRPEPGSSNALHGFMTIDEARLNALPDQDFLRLRAEGWLAHIYAHLFSLGVIDRLRRLSAPANA
ncbi:MAG TPA: SapC family protein [Roseiarcus sp.]|nr:SapC family protein [Roseiarcus sp.]